MLSCPRCHRTNPDDAVFCYHDGAELRPVQGSAPPGRLIHEFVFPSGRRCRSYDDFAQACQDEWSNARDLLRQGRFAQYFATLGRMDLARAAQAAVAQKDLDVGLNDFINRLPAELAPPRLELEPRRIHFGPLRPGEQSEASLTVANAGKGLLLGSIVVEPGADWLTLAEANGQGEVALRATGQQIVLMRVQTKDLAAPQSYGGLLRVITNGGIVEAPVQLDLTTHAFAKAPFQGARTPREMAERMRANPKAAAPLLESGDLLDWFAVNAWAYPVQGPTAKGVAAVQQFFEGMGLAKPPPVTLATTEARSTLKEGEIQSGQTLLRAAAKKWVYAQVHSDVPWLRVASETISGPQQAVIAYQIDASLLPPGKVQEGRIEVIANGGQKLRLVVRADVKVPVEPRARRLLRPLVTGAVVALAARLFLAGGADVYARVLMASAAAPQPPGGFFTWSQPPADLHFVRHFIEATWWLGTVLGFFWIWRRRTHWADLPCGLIAGTVAGLIASGTLACLWPFLEAPPQLLWRYAGLAAGPGVPAPASAWLWTPIWIALAVLWWMLLGMALGFVLSLLSAGRRLLTLAAEPLAWLLRLVGMNSLAAWFVVP